MVSLRRRRLLGLCPGRNSFLPQFPESSESANACENPTQKPKWSLPFTACTTHSVDSPQPKELNLNVSEAGTESTNISGSGSSKEDQTPQISGEEIKRRKRHRRKNSVEQGLSAMRGVYFKNHKWQAAIKVDKKQIHLGTVGSREEAAHLYDRAAFMCGREPNFELSEEEKQELRQFKWDEFLTMTRSAITNKKHHRRGGVGLRKKLPSSGDRTASELSASELEPDTSLS